MQRRFFLISMVIVASTLFAANHIRADVTVTYGSVENDTVYIDLKAETANQAVLFFASGIVADGGADSLEFDAQVGDGGAANGGMDTTPVMSSIDLITGTIWDSANTLQTDVEDNPLVRQSIVETGGNLVSSNGLIGTIVFDTTGFGTGEIDFLLTGVAGTANTTVFNGSTALTTLAPNGIIRVTNIPEPSSSLFLFAGLLGLGIHRRRRG